MTLDSAQFNLTEAVEDVATLVSSKAAIKDLEFMEDSNTAYEHIIKKHVKKV